MTSRTLFSDQPRPSEVPSEADAVSSVEHADFRRWLIHDLRPKGAPSQAPPSERTSPPQGLEPQSLLVPVQKEAELASWLLRDLKPRSSAPPEALSQKDALSRTAAAVSWTEALAWTESVSPAQAPPASEAPPSSSSLSLASPLTAQAPDSLPPPDSLVPHAVSEAPRALASTSDVALDAEDLAVLPSSRARSGGQRRWRHVAVLAALLGALAFLLLRRSGPEAEAARNVDPSLSVPLAAAPLPPPPPQLQEEGSEADEHPPLTLAAHRASAAPAETEPPELSGPRGRRAGDAVARFADLPLPTLSKLARDERQKARSRDARARAQKAASNSRP